MSELEALQADLEDVTTEYEGIMSGEIIIYDSHANIENHLQSLEYEIEYLNTKITKLLEDEKNKSHNYHIILT